MKRSEMIEILLNDLKLLYDHGNPGETAFKRAQIVEALCLIRYNWEEDE